MQRQEGRRNVLAADLGVACTLNHLFSGTPCLCISAFSENDSCLDLNYHTLIFSISQALL